MSTQNPLEQLVARWDDWNDTSMTPRTCSAELDAAKESIARWYRREAREEVRDALAAVIQADDIGLGKQMDREFAVAFQKAARLCDKALAEAPARLPGTEAKEKDHV